MTFEEYKDLNRKLSVGLMLSAIPIPGMMHHYAGERNTAKKMRYVAGAGFAILFSGVSSYEESNKWADSKYTTIEIDGLMYEKIPVSTTYNSDGIVTSTDYKLIPLKKMEGKGKGYLVALGAGILIVNYIYDYIHGIILIESKRDKVRFKYGKKLDFSFIPGYNYQSKTASLNFTYKF